MHTLYCYFTDIFVFSLALCTELADYVNANRNMLWLCFYLNLRNLIKLLKIKIICDLQC